MNGRAARFDARADRSALPVRWALWIGVIAGALAFESGIVLTSARLWAALDPAQWALSQSRWLTEGHKYGAMISIVAVLSALMLALRDSRKEITGTLAFIAAVGCVSAFFAPLVSGGAAPAIAAAVHAFCGQIVFAGLCIAAVLASTDFQSSPQISLAGGFPLRGVALWLPLVLLSQVAMGALYRHDIWSVMPHMGGAMATAFLIVGEAVVLLQRAPDHRLLSIASKAALWFVLLQVLLGICDFLVRLLDFQDSIVWFALSIAHASLGSLTFVAGSCLAFIVRASLIPVSESEQTASMGS